MKKIILLVAGLFSACTTSFGQTEKMLFVVDSVPLINNPEDWNEILDQDILDMTVIKNKDSLRLLGLEDFDSVTYIFTKEYRSRPDSIKKIPSLKKMKRESDAWSFYGIPYSGKYIDYYNSGRKQNEGTLLNGKLHGELKIYYQNGTLGSAYKYKEGIADGISFEYFKTGALSQKKGFKDGRAEGLWETYFPGGQTGHRSTVKDDKLVGPAINYYSTGKVDETIIHNRSKGNIDYLLNQVYQNQRAGDSKAVIKICLKIIKTDSTNTAGYFYEGVAMLEEFRYEEAIELFDKALSIEPLLKHALVYRAMARIKKYEMGNNRAISKNKEVTVVDSAEKPPMPADVKEKVCTDLMKVDSLQTMYGYGDRNLKFITEALLKYCQLDTRR